MNLVADEGVDRQIVEQLRSDGHDVIMLQNSRLVSMMILFCSRLMIGKPS